MAEGYAVLTYTVCDGWVNCWTVDDAPQTFATRDEAEAEIEAFLAEIDADIIRGDRSPEDGYSRSEFRVARVDAVQP